MFIMEVALPKNTAFNFIYPNKQELEELKEYTKRNREEDTKQKGSI